MKSLKIFLTIIVLLLTVVVCSIRPELHKTFVVTGSDFKLERYTEAPSATKIVKNTAEEYHSTREVKIEPSAFLNEQNKVVKNPVEASPEFREENKKIDEPKSTKKLTKREELIAWNSWRSKIQNEIMLKADVSAPLGTMFYFSFKVDKFRHLSNIRAFCSNPFYQKEVYDKLIPKIKEYEYTQLLEFPEGTARESTKFNGMFIIWYETSLSSPGDFNDVERVNVYE